MTNAFSNYIAIGLCASHYHMPLIVFVGPITVFSLSVCIWCSVSVRSRFTFQYVYTTHYPCQSQRTTACIIYHDVYSDNKACGLRNEITLVMAEHTSSLCAHGLMGWMLSWLTSIGQSRTLVSDGACQSCEQVPALTGGRRADKFILQFNFVTNK